MTGEAEGRASPGKTKARLAKYEFPELKTVRGLSHSRSSCFRLRASSTAESCPIAHLCSCAFLFLFFFLPILTVTLLRGHRIFRASKRWFKKLWADNVLRLFSDVYHLYLKSSRLAFFISRYEENISMTEIVCFFDSSKNILNKEGMHFSYRKKKHTIVVIERCTLKLNTLKFAYKI